MNEAELEKATAAISKAQESHIAQLMHHAAAGTVAPPSKVKIAKEAAAEIESELTCQREALAKLKSDLSLWAKEVSLAETEREAAISAVLSPLVGRLIERGEQIASELKPIRSALNALWRERSPANHEQALSFEESRRPLSDSLAAVAEFLTTSAIDRVVPDPWSTARAKLREDPHAELPELDALLSGDLG